MSSREEVLSATFSIMETKVSDDFNKAKLRILLSESNVAVFYDPFTNTQNVRNIFLNTLNWQRPRMLCDYVSGVFSWLSTNCH